MRVLGIDPGYDRLGIAVLERSDSGGEKLIHSECLTTESSLPLQERLVALGTEFIKLLETHAPDCVAMEMLFFNKNQKTAMAVAETRGMLIYLARTHNKQVFEYTPPQVKVAVTGYGKSDKKQVADMVQRLLPDMRDGALDDEYDAVAVGITCLASERSLST